MNDWNKMINEAEFYRKMYEAGDKLIRAYREERRNKRDSHEIIQSRWDCGCITCICEDEAQCQGCGARACMDYPECACGRDGMGPDPDGFLATSRQREMVEKEIRWMQVEAAYDELEDFKENLLVDHRHRATIMIEIGEILTNAGLGSPGSTVKERAMRAVERIRYLEKRPRSSTR